MEIIRIYAAKLAPREPVRQVAIRFDAPIPEDLSRPKVRALYLQEGQLLAQILVEILPSGTMDVCLTHLNQAREQRGA